MNISEQIEKYITSQPELKRSDMQALHDVVLQIMPGCKLWFDDGKASVTGYCIKFKKLKDINIDVLEAAVRYGVEVTGEK